MKLTFTLIGFLLLSVVSLSQSNSFGFNQLGENQKSLNSPFCLPNQAIYKTAILKHKWQIHSENEKWIYFTASADQLYRAYKNNEIPDFQIEYAPPHLLNDSMRANHQINEVHDGIGLSSTFKGKDIIIGFVDTGIEINHPDFKDTNGKTRILRIWDQSVTTGGTLSSYGYGIVWDSTQINAGQCTSFDAGGHGSTVSGASSGNGNATNYNQGVAPESDIIMIKTNFNLPNWTLTVADACEYVFKVADSLGKKAVVNLSVGTYLGSHDGTDPASVRIENLLDEKDGRIVVSACGNSGNFGNYHCQGNVTNDTTFVWFQNNPSSSFGANKIFFDLYSNSSESAYSYAFKAISPSNGYSTQATLNYRPAMGSLGTPIFDTLRNSNGDRIATLEIYTEIEDDNFHMQVLFSNIDSTNYLYGLYTLGSGKYDLWSGSGLGYNKIIEVLPSSSVIPSIIHYQLPDANQTIVSSWNCSPKVVSVGNTRNRSGFPTYAGGYYSPSDVTPVGKLSPNSSKGPNRLNLIKPDITASGDVMLSVAPIVLLQNPSNFTRMDVGGWHIGNGGTSMASPVVAGVAALYLERCSKGNYAEYIDLLKTKSTSNAFTGTLPNNAYGYGSVNAYNILLDQEYSVTISGNDSLCVGPSLFDFSTTETISSVVWSNGNTSFTNPQYTAGDVFVKTYNTKGCEAISDTINVIQLTVETIDPIQVSDDFLTLTTLSSNATYQWTIDGNDIPGETNSTLILTEPTFGMFDCYTTGIDDCKAYAGGVGIYLSNEKIEILAPSIYPNPTQSELHILSESQIKSIQLFDITGKLIPVQLENNKISMQELSNGYYNLLIETETGVFNKKVIKN